LRYDRFQPELSLVNPAYHPQTRWIGNPENPASLRDYDALLPENGADKAIVLARKKTAAPL
jgi:hypothetical protein